MNKEGIIDRLKRIADDMWDNDRTKSKAIELYNLLQAISDQLEDKSPTEKLRAVINKL